MTAGQLQVNDVELSVESLGEPANPAVLLLAGATASMLGWDDEFCARLAAVGRYVIRFDYRDTGQSQVYPPGEPGYGLSDLVLDAVGIVKSLGLSSVHVVGSSMGGMIGQVLALDHPDRVASLVLISSSPGAHSSGETDLSEMSAEFHSAYRHVRLPDWSDRAAVVQYCLDIQRPCIGSRPFDEQRQRARHERVFDRARNIASSMINHFAMDHGEPWRDRLGDLAVPTLVVHGDEDPVHPFDHALALTREIPDAQLLRLAGAGHELQPADWDVALDAIRAHTRAR